MNKPSPFLPQKNNIAAAALADKRRPISVRVQCEYRRSWITESVKRFAKKIAFWFSEEKDALALAEILECLEALEGALMRAVNGQEERLLKDGAECSTQSA